ncbi:ABC transporter substrate-binding protein [Niallia sp. Krafla_26]|uniref:ABC transporter substrate-binding protein n=1 Tax=Niallia sp. Krafla_26 TaxID=3064703 RepID=UPI003D18226A
MKKRFYKALLGASLTGLLLAGCSSGQEAASDGYAIGIALPLSGSSAEYGEDLKNGAELAVKLANDAGGIDGKEIETVIKDDKSDPKEATSVASSFGNEKSVLGVVGHFNSSATLAAAPTYNKNQLVTVAPASSSPNVTDAGDYIFRVITSDAFQAEFVSDWSSEEGFKTAAVIYDQTDFGTGLKEVYTERAAENGLDIVNSESYVAGQTKDFSTILTKIKQNSPDVIFIGGLANDAATITKQARNAGIESVFIGVDSLYSATLTELGGESVEGLLLPGFYDPNSDREATQAFINAYKEEYGKSPGAYAAYSFDSASVLIEAFKSGATTREEVKEKLYDLADFEGVTGNLTFDENGDVETEPQKLIVKDGQFVAY